MGAAALLDDGIVDEVALERAMKGIRVELTPRERAELARRVHERGGDLAAVQRVLRTNRGTAARILSLVIPPTYQPTLF